MDIISIFLSHCQVIGRLGNRLFLRPRHLDRQMHQLAICPSKVAYGHEFHISILRVYGIASPEGTADVA